jgi:hypothetical protein
MSTDVFVLTKPGVEAGETLDQISRWKGKARLNVNNVFW